MWQKKLDAVGNEEKGEKLSGDRYEVRQRLTRRLYVEAYKCLLLLSHSHIHLRVSISTGWERIYGAAPKMNRQRIDIMAQILAFCTRARRRTRIMYKTNLSHAQLKTYMTFLTSQDLLAHDSDGYFTTEKGHRFLEAFAWLNDVLEDRVYGAFSVILKESYEEVEIAHGGTTAKTENAQAQTKVKKAAIVVLINLAHEEQKKTSDELKTEIHKALEEGLARIPWAEIKKVIILEE